MFSISQLEVKKGSNPYPLRQRSSHVSCDLCARDFTDLKLHTCESLVEDLDARNIAEGIYRSYFVLLNISLSFEAFSVLARGSHVEVFGPKMRKRR